MSNMRSIARRLAKLRAELRALVESGVLPEDAIWLLWNTQAITLECRLIGKETP